MDASAEAYSPLGQPIPDAFLGLIGDAITASPQYVAREAAGRIAARDRCATVEESGASVDGVAVPLKMMNFTGERWSARG